MSLSGILVAVVDSALLSIPIIDVGVSTIVGFATLSSLASELVFDLEAEIYLFRLGLFV